MQPIRLSIVMPAYKAQRYIGESLRGVIAQLGEGDEVVVVDDGCPNGGYQELTSNLSPKLKLIELKSNRGVSGARNAGIDAAIGDYIVFLDADDLLGPGQLDAIREHLAGDPAIDIVMVPAQEIDEQGQAIEHLREPNLWPDKLEGLLQGSSVSTSQTTVRRSALIDAGLFDPFIRYCEDWDLWLRLACRGYRFSELRNGTYVCYRRHATQASADHAKIAAGWEQVLAHARAYLPDRQPYQKLLREAGWNIRLYRNKNRVYQIKQVGGLSAWLLDRLATVRARAKRCFARIRSIKHTHTNRATCP